MASQLLNKISDSSEEHGRKEDLKDPIRNPPCPTGKDKPPNSTLFVPKHELAHKTERRECYSSE